MSDHLTAEPRNCGDCGAKPGELHQRGCDVERCSLCGGQAISCGCVYTVNGMPYSSLEEDHPDIYANGPTDEMHAKLDAEVERCGGRLPWTGQWPGEAECIEFGWLRPDGGPDLNRLNAWHAVWSKEQRRWLKP